MMPGSVGAIPVCFQSQPLWVQMSRPATYRSAGAEMDENKGAFDAAQMQMRRMPCTTLLDSGYKFPDILLREYCVDCFFIPKICFVYNLPDSGIER